MDTYETILFEEKDGVAWIRMNRPEALNAMNLTMNRELCRAVSHCRAEKRVRVVVFTGTGGVFSGGGDVKAFARSLEDGDRVDLDIMEMARHFHAFVAEIARMPKPVVAAVNGVAAGAGFASTLACDLTVATEKAKFFVGYSGIGLCPDSGTTYFLSRLVGEKKAKEILFLNEPIGAEEALRLGIVNRVFSTGEFEKGVSDLVNRLANGPTAAYGTTKELLRLGMHETLEAQLDRERESVGITVQREEFREGVSAFVEKRKPDFKSVA